MWEEAIKVVDDAVEALRRLPLIVHLDGAKSIAVLGDVHGYDDVVDRFEQLVDEFSVDKAVMLGDYVDRGPNSSQTIVKVLSLASSEPNRFIPLRGDHEDPRMNEGYGFYEEVLYMQATDLFSHVVEAYQDLPVAAVGLGAFLVHGGVPCADCARPDVPVSLSSVELQYSSIKGTSRYLELTDDVLFQMLWNDPNGDAEYFEPNPRGPGIYYYGRLAWSSFLRENGLNLIIRGHEVVDGAFAIRRDGKPMGPLRCNEWRSRREVSGGVITVFSSRYHGGRAGALIIDDDDGLVLKCL
ncbi:metallophosphoesterase [Acidilobus sp.]|uniref:metallophosphoesterase n=1 Tax=Acidilobus sp. TaxID=1872109 RepID=UPI003D0513E0